MQLCLPVERGHHVTASISFFVLPAKTLHLKLIVLQHEMSHGLPMLFPRAHAVSILYQSCSALAVSPCTHKRPIEAARPEQTPLRGLAQMPDNRPDYYAYVTDAGCGAACILECESGPVSVCRSCCEDSSKSHFYAVGQLSSPLAPWS